MTLLSLLGTTLVGRLSRSRNRTAAVAEGDFVDSILLEGIRLVLSDLNKFLCQYSSGGLPSGAPVGLHRISLSMKWCMGFFVLSQLILGRRLHFFSGVWWMAFSRKGLDVPILLPSASRFPLNKPSLGYDIHIQYSCIVFCYALVYSRSTVSWRIQMVLSQQHHWHPMPRQRSMGSHWLQLNNWETMIEWCLVSEVFCAVYVLNGCHPMRVAIICFMVGRSHHSGYSHAYSLFHLLWHSDNVA